VTKKLLQQLKTDVQDVLCLHPELTVKESNGIPKWVEGDYYVRDLDGVEQGVFNIRVHIPAEYPYGFPIMVEVSTRIERKIDRHISLKGLTCQEITQKEKMIAAAGITLRRYFAEYVHKYLCWQLIYEEEGNENLEEWAHDQSSTLAFYQSHLNIQNPILIRRCLEHVAANKVSGRNDPCLCNSGKKTKHCHEEAFNELKFIGKDQLLKDIQTIG
jgi:hypothetical protein